MKKLFDEKTGISGKYRFITKKAGTDEVLRTSEWIDNLVMNGVDTGVNILLKTLIGTITANEITSASIGTGTTAPTDSDTNLQTPVTTDIPRATQSISPTNVLTILFFIPDGDLPNGTYNEFGLFCETQIFSRSIISPAYVKSSTEDTIVEYQITINN